MNSTSTTPIDDAVSNSNITFRKKIEAIQNTVSNLLDTSNTSFRELQNSVDNSASKIDILIEDSSKLMFTCQKSLNETIQTSQKTANIFDEIMTQMQSHQSSLILSLNNAMTEKMTMLGKNLNYSIESNIMRIINEMNNVENRTSASHFQPQKETKLGFMRSVLVAIFGVFGLINFFICLYLVLIQI